MPVETLPLTANKIWSLARSVQRTVHMGGWYWDAILGGSAPAVTFPGTANVSSWSENFVFESI